MPDTLRASRWPLRFTRLPEARPRRRPAGLIFPGGSGHCMRAISGLPLWLAPQRFSLSQAPTIGMRVVITLIQWFLRPTAPLIGLRIHRVRPWERDFQSPAARWPLQTFRIKTGPTVQRRPVRDRRASLNPPNITSRPRAVTARELGAKVNPQEMRRRRSPRIPHARAKLPTQML